MEVPPTWMNHPLTIQGSVELVPTDWLFTFRGPDVSPELTIKRGTVVDMESLWESIQKNGLDEPVIMRVGIKNKKFRLESGNHRIQLFKQYGVEYTPATVQIQDYCGPDVQNVMTIATHNFDFTDDIILPDSDNGYVKPSSVFKSLVGNVKSF